MSYTITEAQKFDAQRPIRVGRAHSIAQICATLSVVFLASLGHAAEPGASETGTVVDLCQLPVTRSSGVGWTKQRVVLFDLAGSEVTNGPEKEKNEKGQEIGAPHFVFRDAKVHDHLRNVFFGTFPMDRMHTVPARIPAPATLFGKASLRKDEMIRVAELDPFAAYSIACAEWVVAPRIASKEATFRKVKKSRTQGNSTIEYLAWDLDSEFEIEIAVYKYQEGTWTLAATLKDSGALTNTSIALAEMGHQVNQVVSGMGEKDKKPLLSSLPEPTCRVPLVDDLKEVADGYSQCGRATLAVATSASHALVATPSEKAAGGNEASKPTVGTAPANDAGQSGPNGKPSSSSRSGTTTASGEDTKHTSSAPATAQSADDAEKSQEAPTLSDAERATLAVASGSNPTQALKELATKALEDNAPSGVVEAVGAAQTAVKNCQAGVETIIKVSDRLRSLAKQSLVQTARQAVLGFASCSGVPLTYDLGNATPPGTAQLHSSHCKALKDDVSRGAVAMRDVAVCKARIASERATLMVQKLAKNEVWPIGIPLFSLASARSNEFGIAVGREEGIKRGDMFIARDARGDSLGYGYVVQQGAGGPSGVSNPSRFRFRVGEAPAGTTIQEHAKVGLLLGGRPQFGWLFRKNELASDWLVGGAIEGGYNAGQFVGVGDEFWVRANLTLMRGRESETFINIEMLPEAQYYLFSHVAGFIQSGAALNLATKPAPSGSATSESLSGLGFALMLGLGLDVAMHPDWNLRLAATGAQGLSKLQLKNKAKTQTIDAGLLTYAQGSASLAYTF